MEKNNEVGNNNKRNVPPKKDGVNQYSINERIRAREVRLVGENVEQGVEKNTLYAHRWRERSRK